MVESNERAALGRRSLLRGALAAPVGVAALPLLTAKRSDASTDADRSAVSPRSGHHFDGTSVRFAIAVLPDTQYLFDADSADPEPLRATFRYLVAERKEANIAFLAHLGDVTEHGTEDEISLASDTFTAIDGKVPYSVLAGNHDVRSSTDDQRGDSAYLRAFGPKRFARMPTFGGSSPDGYNSYHVLTAADRKWLILALDWRASDKGLAWAQNVLDTHATLPVILTTHDLAAANEAGEAGLSDHGRRLWDRIIRKNDQIFLTLNGHYWPPGRTVLTNDAGNPVHVHIANYQDRYYGGAGMVRMYSFDLARNVIDVETFSPWFLARDPAKRTLLERETIELTGPVDRFSLNLDFVERFSGFDPVKQPAPRPAAAVMPRGTVAYWRFDGAGLSEGPSGSPVAEGTIARDLTGRGNDVKAHLLHSSGAEVLTRTQEHHPAQPAHGSLRFDGGQGPDRGAVLRTGPDAPINSMKFEGGYTIEVFIKLPDPFVGNHAWMGILSWEGRASDAGKFSGWSPDEPTCSLNLSGERFLQFVAYPSDRDADPTSWSHALPVGRWMHLAVVNNSRHTTVYVDGSKIARNPTQAAHGIATVGKPFAIGGTQFAERFGQGFYGWIGDVRIVSRALRPDQFLTAVDD